MLEVSQLGVGTAAPPPFFIVGAGRSGSTLLRLMLASHSRIAIPPETWFLLPLVERLPIDRDLSGAELHQAIAIMTSHYRWPDMQISADELRECAARLPSAGIGDLARIVYDIHLRRTGKVRWADKTPPYIRILPQLATLFPGARFICLVRDGRDVAKSFQSLMIYGKTIRQNTIEWLEANRWERKWLASAQADSMLRVRYEDLVVDPESVLRAICAFIGEQFEPHMLTWQESVERLVPERERHVHEKLTRRTRHEDVARWEHSMSSAELFMAEAFMGRDLQRLGYERRLRAPLWRPLFWAARAYFDFLLPLNPIGVLPALARKLTRGRACADVEEFSAADTGQLRGPGPRAVDPSKVGWRRYLR